MKRNRNLPILSCYESTWGTRRNPIEGVVSVLRLATDYDSVTVPLDDALIAELSTRPDNPVPSAALRKLRGTGARYCRARDSFAFPPRMVGY